MRNVRNCIFVLLYTTLLVFYSCHDPNNNNGGGSGGGNGGSNKENQEINESIHNDMKLYYYWNEELPDSKLLDFDAEPNDFFFSMLYKYREPGGDRFSYLEKDGVPYHAKKTVSASVEGKKDVGFEYQAFSTYRGIELCVTYVKKGTKAEEKGLKRGDWIVEVDGEKPNEKNYYSILDQGKTAYKLKMGNGHVFELETTANFKENPIYLYDTFNEGKIGYIIYNFFDNDSGDKTYEYALMMNEILTKISTVDYLILDLRYNPGGLVLSGNYIASALVPNRNADGVTVYTRRAFNKEYTEKLKQSGTSYYERQSTEFFKDNIQGVEIPRMNLKGLYVITSSRTASASEQIINGLSPYFGYGDKLHVIGETTTGKNMESYSLSNKKHKWILHPLVAVSYKSDSTPEKNDYSLGLKPTISWYGLNSYGVWNDNLENDEFQTLREEGVLYPLGDKKERLLAKALEHITGQEMSAIRSKRSIAEPLDIKSIGSSLDRKQEQMIINIEE